MNNFLNAIAVFLLFVLFSDGSITSTSPIDVEKYTVVIIEETESRQSLPSSQLSAITSQVWRDYVSEQDGQWRVLDPDTDVTNEESWVKQSLKVERGSIPWLIFSNKSSGDSIPLPKNLDQLMEKIKQ